MRKVSSLIILFFMSCSFGLHAQDEIPAIETGNWFNPNDPGTGFFLEAQNGILAGMYLGYENDGDPLWVNFAGPLGQDEANSSVLRLTADLYAFENGQCIINCVDDSSNSNLELEVIGTITLEFSDRDRGQFSVDGGEFQPIEAYIFGIDTLLVSEDVPEFRVPDVSGDWVFSLEQIRFVTSEFVASSAINVTIGEMIKSEGDEFDSITFPITTMDDNPDFFGRITGSEDGGPTTIGELRCVARTSDTGEFSCGISDCTEGDFCPSDEQILNNCGSRQFPSCVSVLFNDHRLTGLLFAAAPTPPVPVLLINGFRKNYD